MDCKVTVHLEKRVSIVFEDFVVEYDNTCDIDWLEVHDGDSPDSDMIGEKLCGYEFPNHMESSGNSMTFAFIQITMLFLSYLKALQQLHVQP